LATRLILVQKSPGSSPGGSTEKTKDALSHKEIGRFSFALM